MELGGSAHFFAEQIELYFENMEVHTTNRSCFVRIKAFHELFALRDKAINSASKIHTRNLSREPHQDELGEAPVPALLEALVSAYLASSLPVMQGKAPDASDPLRSNFKSQVPDLSSCLKESATL